MKPKPKTQIVDPDDPKGSVLRVADEMGKREIQRKARAARKRKRLLAADTPEAVHWLGRSFYRPVAEALLADPANFDEDGMPTEDAMHQAIDTMVETAATMLLDFNDCNAEDIFHRIRLDAFVALWGLDD